MQRLYGFQNRLLAVGLSSLAIIGLGIVPSAQAIEFPDAGDRGAPSRTAGGGTRGEWCDGNGWTEWSARALVPSNNVSTFSGQQASLWLHLSESFYDKTAEVYIQDLTSNDTVYEQQVDIASLNQEARAQDNLIKVDLPEFTGSGAPLLETGKTYYWDFSIICNPNDRAQDYVVRGILHRVEADADLAETIATASPIQQLENYASAGLWQEALQTAALLKEEQPHLWVELLSSVGLSRLAAETANREYSNENEVNLTDMNLTEVNSTEMNLTDMNLTSVGSMAVDR